MKRIKTIALSALLAIGAFGATTFSSCNTDECKDVVCNNGGFCVGGTCSCPTGYEGATCLTESRTKFIKSWSASDQIGTTNLVYTVAVASGTSVTSVIISNAFSDDFFTNPISATVDGNSITIPDQRPDGSASNFRVAGTGTYSGGRINWTYTITKITPNEVKSHTGVWQ